MAANNSDPIPDQLGEGGAGVKHETGEEVGEETSSSAAQATATTMLPRSSSRPQLDLSGAAIHGTLEDRNPTILLPNQSDDISHLALDIGGTCVPPCKSPRLRFTVGLNSVYRSVAM
jgi:type II pantothenate kinase